MGINILVSIEHLTFADGMIDLADGSALFEALGYLAANPDVAAAGVNPLDHFLTFGIYEGRQNIDDGLFH